ncbi:MAG: hypothetical protein ACT4P6_16775 [Gemmatimonadaceae bacterium]
MAQPLLDANAPPGSLTAGDSSFGDVSPAEFRAQGHIVVDWLADYFERLDGGAVTSDCLPGELRRSQPSEAPRDADCTPL